jgi:hypothetical protein
VSEISSSGSLIEHTKFDLHIRDRQRTRTLNRADVFGTGIALPGRADGSQVAAEPYRLQQCAVLGSAGIKLS